jgi:ribosomal protein L16 Arg81 hydroxylase
MRFSELIAPVTAERFMSDFYGHKPLHVPSSAECPRAAMISWTRMNDLLSLRSHWTEANIKLIMNSRPVSPEHYIREVDTLGGTVRRADLAKVDLFMAMGASLVANSVEDVSPEVRAVISSLGDQFSARAGANIYCSFKDVQAFASHCDLHEVFAVQCEGEKVWNIYENRAAAPVEALTGADAQAIIDRAKGRILHQVRMRPGDLLYIPRGYYHDALASSGASLHVTFSVTPLNGRILFRLLEEAAVQDAAFRDYLPDAREANGVRLEERLADLAGRISALVTSNSFKTTVATRQRMLCDPNYQAQLPSRPNLDFYARSDRQAVFEADASGERLKVGGTRIPLGTHGAAAEWLLGRRAFSLQELFATYPHMDQDSLRALVGALERAGAIFAYTPEL